MKKYIILILLVFMLSSCNEHKDIERVVELHYSDPEYSSIRLEHDSKFANITIYQRNIDGQLVNLVSVSGKSEDVEIRYYCGFDDTGDQIGVIDPSYLYEDEYWDTIETDECQELGVFVTVYHFDDGFNEWVGSFQHREED